MKKRILCFGDSLTWGYYPGTGERIEERWPVVMAEDLGSDYQVSEDAINGRTTVFERPWSEYRVGLKALPYTLISQKPLDLVIVFLGANDYVYAKNSIQAKEGMERIIRYILHADINERIGSLPTFTDKPRILMVIPAPARFPDAFGEEQIPLGNEMQSVYEETAKAYGIDYIFAKDIATSSDIDGVHYMPDQQIKLGHAIAKKVKEIFAE